MPLARCAPAGALVCVGCLLKLLRNKELKLLHLFLTTPEMGNVRRQCCTCMGLLSKEDLQVLHRLWRAADDLEVRSMAWPCLASHSAGLASPWFQVPTSRAHELLLRPINPTHRPPPPMQITTTPHPHQAERQAKGPQDAEAARPQDAEAARPRNRAGLYDGTTTNLTAE